MIKFLRSIYAHRSDLYQGIKEVFFALVRATSFVSLIAGPIMAMMFNVWLFYNNLVIVITQINSGTLEPKALAWAFTTFFFRVLILGVSIGVSVIPGILGLAWSEDK